MLTFERKYGDYVAEYRGLQIEVCQFNDRTWGVSVLDTYEDEWVTKGLRGSTENYRTRRECYARAEEVARAQR